QAEIRLQANPASLDYLPVADAVEDHATMATLGAARADAVLGFARSLLAIELLCAAQAIDLRGQPRLGAGTHVVYHAVRARVPFIAADVLLAPSCTTSSSPASSCTPRQPQPGYAGDSTSAIRTD